MSEDIAIYFLISFLIVSALAFLGWMSTKRKRGATPKKSHWHPRYSSVTRNTAA